MKTRMTLSVRALAMVLGVLILTVGSAQAQVKAPQSNLPRVDATNSGSLIPWGIAGVFTLGILGVAFRNAKRTHSD